MNDEKIYVFTLFLSALILTGCKETKSVDCWTEHHDEAVKKEAKCEKSGSDSQNCKNVKEANFRYQQLHAKAPSFSDYFKKYKERNAQK